MENFNKDEWRQRVASIQNQDDATLSRTMDNLSVAIDDLGATANRLYKESNTAAGMQASELCDEAKSLWNICVQEQNRRTETAREI